MKTNQRSKPERTLHDYDRSREWITGAQTYGSIKEWWRVVDGSRSREVARLSSNLLTRVSV